MYRMKRLPVLLRPQANKTVPGRPRTFRPFVDYLFFYFIFCTLILGTDFGKLSQTYHEYQPTAKRKKMAMTRSLLTTCVSGKGSIKATFSKVGVRSPSFRLWYLLIFPSVTWSGAVLTMHVSWLLTYWSWIQDEVKSDLRRDVSVEGHFTNWLGYLIKSRSSFGSNVN